MQTVFTNVPHLAEIMNKEKSHQVRIMTFILYQLYYTFTLRIETSPLVTMTHSYPCPHYVPCYTQELNTLGDEHVSSQHRIDLSPSTSSPKSISKANNINIARQTSQNFMSGMYAYSII